MNTKFQMRCTVADKHLWEQAAHAEHVTLSDWLKAAAHDRLQKKPVASPPQLHIDDSWATPPDVGAPPHLEREYRGPDPKPKR